MPAEIRVPDPPRKAIPAAGKYSLERWLQFAAVAPGADGIIGNVLWIQLRPQGHPCGAGRRGKATCTRCANQGSSSARAFRRGGSHPCSGGGTGRKGEDYGFRHSSVLGRSVLAA